jgi:hypothetical protein
MIPVKTYPVVVEADGTVYIEHDASTEPGVKS